MPNTQTQIHNPLGLPSSVLPQGCRFLDADEVGRQFQEPLQELNVWSETREFWYEGGWSGNDLNAVYCTSLSRDALAQARNASMKAVSLPPPNLHLSQSELGTLLAALACLGDSSPAVADLRSKLKSVAQSANG